MPTIKKISLNGVSYDIGGGLTEDVKQASLQIAEKVAYIDEHGQDYYDELYTAFYDNMWNVTNTLSNAVNSNPATKTLKDGTYTAIISATTGYTLEGATVSVTMNGANITSSVYNNGTISIPSVTGDVVITVVAVALTVVSISAVYTQSGTVYNTDTLDSLKTDLVVTAHFDDSSEETVTTYTLSGTLTVGTSTITVTYLTETATFNVTVTAYWDIEWDYTQGTPIGNGFEHTSAVTGSMQADGYQLKGTSSGGCNIILTDTSIGTADNGESEIVIRITTMKNEWIGFHFDAKNIWGAIIQSNKLYYQNVPSTPLNSTTTLVSGITMQTNTDYTLRLVWDQTSGTSLYVDGTLVYTITGALNGTNRTRWFVSSDSASCVALVKSMKVRAAA